MSRTAWRTIVTAAAGVALTVHAFAGDLVVKGRVTCEGSGVPGVRVTDGENFAVTDDKGNYALQADTRNRFVYITVPSGYDAPVERGVVQFFRPMPESSKEKCDFLLHPRSTSDNKFGLIVISDPQPENEGQLYALRPRVMEIANVAASASRPFIGICCGDLTYTKYDLLPQYNDLMSGTGITFRNVIGNHDFQNFGRSFETSLSVWEDLYGPAYYSYDVGQVHFVALNDNFYIGRLWYYIAYLQERQLKWLEKDLSYVPEGSTVFLMMHIPTTRDASDLGAGFTYPGVESVLANNEGLYEILKPYNVHILSGHLHEGTNRIIGDHLYEHVIPSLGGNFFQGPLCGDGTPAGYEIFEIDGSKVNWQYKSAGHPARYQMEIYTDRDNPRYSGYAVANIWNYDPSWKVTFTFDRFDIVPGEAFRSVDAKSADLYGDGAYEAGHFLRAPLPKGAQQIEVKAEDGRGHVYTEVRTLPENYWKENYMWIDGEANYARMSSRDSVQRYLQKCRDAGFRNVIVDIKPISGEVLYDSDIAPFMGEFGSAHRDRGYDMLGHFIEDGHKLGMKVYASMNVFCGGNLDLQRGILYGDKQRWQTTLTTPGGLKTVSEAAENCNGMLNPADPEVQEYELSLIREAVRRYPQLDGMVFDRMRFASVAADFSDLSRKAYEAYAGHEVKNFPEDILQWDSPKDSASAWSPGPEFGQWMAWRASLIKDFFTRARSEMKRIHPGIAAGVYTGSWYPAYFSEGVNWASEEYDPSEVFDWADSSYQKTGFADLLDLYLTGLYYQTVSKEEVDELLLASIDDESVSLEGVRSEEDRIYATNYWFCVEGAAENALRVTRGKAPVIGGIYAGQYTDRKRLMEAAGMAMKTTEGLMLFDLSYVVRDNLWDDLAKLLK